MAINFNTAPYYDDFDADDQFLRILFNPGRSVQARELTQIQSILQNQLSSGADHIWKDGSAVLGADIGVNKRNYIQLAEADATWLGRIVYGTTSGAIGRIVQLHDDETQPIYYIKPLSNEFVVGDVIESYDTICEGIVEAGVCSTNYWYNSSVIERSVAANNAGLLVGFGQGLEATIGNGIFYIGKHFVPVLSQTIFIDYTSADATSKIGLDIQETIIEATSDPRLLDPASGFYNQNAPGADRYSMTLKLIKEDDSIDGTNFISLVTIEDGVVNDPVSRTSYTNIVDELARRTYDESGDYTTKTFPIEIIEDENDPSNYKVKIESGKAYVRGYENELTSNVELTAPKGRTTRHIIADHINANFGPYFEVESLNDISGVFDVFKKEKVNFITNTLYTGGQSLEKIDLEKRITHLTKYGDSFRIYLDTEEGLDIVAPATYIVSAADTTVYAKLYKPTGKAVKKGVFSPWLFNMARMTSELTPGNINYSTQKNYSVTHTGGNSLSIAAGGTGQMHWERILYIYNQDIGSMIPQKGTDSQAAVVWDATYTANTEVAIAFEDQTGALVNAYQGHTLDILANMWVSNSTWKSINHTTKTNVDVVLDTTVETGNELANNKLILEPGVSKIISITDPGNNDVTADFWFFEGDYDTEYKNAYVQWSNPDETVIPQTGTYQVTYEAFTYGSTTTSSFTAVNSFTDGNISYGDIGTYEGFLVPNHYRLADVMDFRCTESNFNEGNYLPLPESPISVAYDYYLPRADRLVLNTDGVFEIKQGFSSEEAILPTERESEMTLYNFYIPPYTYRAKNISISYIDNKNYKMSDLRELDERISSLEYYTALNLLEKDTAAMQVIDSNGFERYKNGMLIDPFVDHGIGDISSTEYFVSIYPEAGICTTPFEMKGYDFEAGTMSGVRKSTNGKTWTLDYSVDDGWIKQQFASSVINLNPFAKMSWVGFLEISPSSDTWFEELFKPDVVVQNENNNAVLAQVEAFGTQTRWGSWSTTWTGWNDQGGKKDFVAGSSEVKFSGRTRNVHGWEGRVDINEMDGHVAANGHTNILGDSLQEIWDKEWMATNTWVANNGYDGIFKRPSKQFDMWRDVIKKSDTWKQDQTRTSTSVRNGTRTYQEAKDIRTTLDNKLLDSSAIGWMRSKDITIKADKLRPSTKIHFQFDGIDVDAYCKPSGGAYYDDIFTDEFGRIVDATFTIPSANAGKCHGGTLDGSVEGELACIVGGGVWNGAGLKFRTGKKFISAQDSFDGTMTTQATASYTAAGTLNTRQRTVMSTLEAETKIEDISDTEIGNETRTTQVGGVETTTTTKKSIREYYDPVAESFMVSNMDGGVFIDSIDIYFYSRDTENTPVRIEIREMNGGYPTWSALPLATKMLYPAEVYTSADGTANTRFLFDDPIYLMNGTEYCFVVISDSLDYNIWISELGEQDRDTGEYINTQPFLGSMFTSQNNSTWTPEQTKDVKFQINKCVFDTTVTGTAQFNMKAFDGVRRATGFTPNFQPMLIQGTDVEYNMVVNSDTQNIISEIRDGVDQVFDTQVSLDGSHTIAAGYSYTPLSILASLSTNNPNISPVFNDERLSVITQNNVVYDTAVEVHNQKGVYISKMVQLANPADDLKMWLSIQEKSETYVKVFYDTGSTIPRHVEVTLNANFNSYGSYTVNDFEEEYAFVYNAPGPSEVVTQGNPDLGNFASWNGTVGAYDSSMYIDGDDDIDNDTKMYVTDISFPQQVIQNSFVSKYDLEGAQRYDPVIDAAGGYSIGDVWYGMSGNGQDADNKFYRRVVLLDGTLGSEEIPLLQITSVVDAAHVDYPMAIIETDPVVWREMKDSGGLTNNPEIATDMQFIEHTFEPLKKITDEFSSFRIKIELHTTDPIYLPAVRELRVLAVT